MKGDKHLKDEIKNAIIRIVERQGNPVFDKKILFKEQKSNIIDNSDTNMEELNKSLNKVLSELSDEEFIKLSPEGYIWLLRPHYQEGDKSNSEANLLEKKIKSILDGSFSNKEEIIKLLDTDDKELRSNFILAIEANNDEDILQNNDIKDKIIQMLLNEEEELVYKDLTSLVKKIYQNDNYFINKLLILLNEESVEIKCKVMDILRYFDNSKVNSHVINMLYNENAKVRINALKILIQNDNYDINNLDKALWEWKNELESVKHITNKDRSDKKKVQSIEKTGNKNVKWKNAVKDAIKKVVERHNDPEFSRQILIDEEMDYIKKVTRTKGKTPEQTLRRTLQELCREENYLSHEGRGIYHIRESENEEDLKKEKKELLRTITEKKINLNDVKKKIIDYSNDKEFLEKLLDSIGDLNWKGRYQFVKIISEINKKIVLEKLVSLLEDSNEWVREVAAGSILEYSSEEVLPMLDTMLQESKNSRSKKYAVEILGDFDDEKSLDILKKTLNDESSSVRLETIRSIDKISHEKAKDILSKAKNSEFADVEREAKRILRDPKYKDKDYKKGKTDKKHKKSNDYKSLLNKNSVYIRRKIHDRLGGEYDSKISVSSNQKTIFLFYNGKKKTKHSSGWQKDGSFHFILNKLDDDIDQFNYSDYLKDGPSEILLFKELYNGKVKYHGPMRVEKYNEIKVKDEVKKVIFKMIRIDKIDDKEEISNVNNDTSRERSKDHSNNSNHNINKKDEKKENKENNDMINSLINELNLD